MPLSTMRPAERTQQTPSEHPRARVRGLRRRLDALVRPKRAAARRAAMERHPSSGRWA